MSEDLIRASRLLSNAMLRIISLDNEPIPKCEALDFTVSKK